jgi:DNA mismatch repair protein MutS2
METFNNIRSYLRSAAIEGTYLDPKAFHQIHKILGLSARIHSFLEQNRPNFPLLQEVAEDLSPNPSLVKEIDKAIDLGTLDIRDQASVALATIRREMARARERVRRQLESLLDRLARKGILQERLITMRSGRWVLPVKETHKHLVKGALHDKSASGATVFLEPLETLELNNQIRRLEAEERHEVEKILRTLTDLVRKNLSELEQNLDILVTVDCIHAAALASKTLDQHAPALNTNGALKIKSGRHPLLVLRKEPLSDVVPLDLAIGENFNTLVITGPNAGGKTVALKTVGLLALMVSCGLHIPADADSEVPIFQRIFAHVGDAQSIEMDLSTFSAHLSEIKTIVEEASPGDLVLIDEIGTGTDPQEGAALAMAVLEVLTARAVVTVVTTHHGSLKAFAHQAAGTANGSMAFDSQTLTPTYKFRADLPGSSYALEIAKRMGLAEGVVSRARSLMGTQANRLEELILKLDQQIERNKQSERDLRTESLLVDGLRSRYEEQNKRLSSEVKQLRHKAAVEADAIIRQANAAVERAIRTIRENGASKAAIHEAKALIQEEKETIEKELEAAMPDEEVQRQDEVAGELRPGDRVWWKRSGVAGTVLSRVDSDGRILAAFGKLKAHVPREELNRIKDMDRPSAAQVSAVHLDAPEEARTETDIRGMRVDEALSVVDKFLNDALLAGLKKVRIIHGVGTGALRNSLKPFLNQHPLVLGTSPGGAHQENRGVTIVEIAGR